uniref:Uncharacterized protein n=1 Tax=Panagrolaimus superbus TaxID=310955 RepID=A0A914YHN9_9BILA
MFDKVTFPKAIHRHGQKHILSSNPSTSKSTEKIEMSESELEEVLTAASTSNSKDVSKVATAASTSNSKDVSKVPTAGHVSQLANLGKYAFA